MLEKIPYGTIVHIYDGYLGKIVGIASIEQPLIGTQYNIEIVDKEKHQQFQNYPYRCIVIPEIFIQKC